MAEVFHSISLNEWQWSLFMLCGLLIGLSKTGLSGAGLMVVPIMAGIFGSKLSVGILLPMLIFADIFAVKYYNRHANWKYVLMLLPWAILGIIIGTFFGDNINDEQFAKLLAIIVITGIVLMLWQDLFGKKITVPDTWWFAAILGLLGGFTTMVGNAAGPVMAMYLLAMRLPKNKYIGTGAWFFFIVNIIKVPFHILSWETITAKTLAVDLVVLPAIVVGIVLGIWTVKRIPEKYYRIFIILSTIVASIFLF